MKSNRIFWKILICSLTIVSYINIDNDLFAQLVINEVSNKNLSQIQDEDGNFNDWIELYNAGSDTVDLNNYYLSDNPAKLLKWQFPNEKLAPSSFIVVQASGKDCVAPVEHTEFAVVFNDYFNCIMANDSTPSNWMDIDFDDSAWENNVLEPYGYEIFSLNAKYVRTAFVIDDTSILCSAKLIADYSDGFIAYLNGVEIYNTGIAYPYKWNSSALTRHYERISVDRNKELPEVFKLDFEKIKPLLKEGKNVLAFSMHKFKVGDGKLSLVPFLGFGLIDTSGVFKPAPIFYKDNKTKRIHSNFKISTNERIYLSLSDTTVVDSTALLNMEVNYSMGHKMDGSKEIVSFPNATPGKSNNQSQSYVECEPKPIFSNKGGFFKDVTSTLISSSSPSSIIKYTKDGSEPTENSATYSNQALNLTNTTVIRAKCFSKTGKMPGKAVSVTYYINSAHKTPVLSISTNNSNLYGSDGIFDHYDESWERPCYIEYFDTSKNKIFDMRAGIEIDGGYGGSRSQPQHSFRLVPGKGLYGEKAIEYALIPDRPKRKHYESIYLRNGSNQYNDYPIKDAILTKVTATGTKNYYSTYSAITIYINGKYFGLYELREKIDADYFIENYNAKSKSIDILGLSAYKGEELRAIEGSKQGFLNDYNTFLSLNPQSDDYLDSVNQFLDVDYYTDYIIGQTWLADTDWPLNNLKIIRNSASNNKWQFCLMDLEWSLDPNGWSTIFTDHLEFMDTINQNIPFIHFWQNLMTNEEYKTYFINRYADIMNTRYLYSNTSKIVQSIYNQAFPEMENQFNKWETVSPQKFTANNNIMLESLENRSVEVRKHMQNHYGLTKQVDVTLNVMPKGAGTIKISTIVPEEYPWNGIYFTNVPITISAQPNPGYQFVSWNESEHIDSVMNKNFSTELVNLNESFTANFQLLGDNSQPIVISEINYNSESSIESGDWIELYNHGDKAVSMKDWSFTDEKNDSAFSFPDDLILNAKERIVLVNDISKFKFIHPEVSNVMGSFNFRLGSPTDTLKLFNNQGVLIVWIVYSDKNWPNGAKGQGRTLELIDINKNLSDPSNWFEGCIGGSPGKKFEPCVNEIIFSEINYQSSTNKDVGDWVEVWNISNNSVDIGEWYFLDKNDTLAFIIPSPQILQPNDRLVLAKKPEDLKFLFPNSLNIIGGFKFGLSSEGEWIRLYDNHGILRQSLQYDVNAPWPIGATGQGFTLEILNPFENSYNGSNWFFGCKLGSPGTEYSDECGSTNILNEDEPYVYNVYPNPANEILKIRLNHPILNEHLNITISNQMGQLVYRNMFVGGDIIEVNVSSFPSGVYMVCVNGANWTSKQNRMIVVSR